MLYQKSTLIFENLPQKKSYFIIGICLLMFTAQASATNWYVDNTASGSNNGSSWTNAWTGFSSISWASIQPGDFLYISGGSTSQTYNDTLSVGANGAEDAPITIQVGQDAGHNGTVIIDLQNNASKVFGISLNNRSYVTLSGQVGTSSDCKIKVQNVIYYGLYAQGTIHHLDIGYLEITQNGLFGIKLVPQPHHQLGEIHHCKLHDNEEDEAEFISATPWTGTQFGSLKIHHNDFYDFHADALKIATCETDFYNNIIRDRGVYHADHPDGIQGWGDHMRIFNNHFYNFTRTDGDTNANSCIRYNPDSKINVNPSHVYIYNNRFTETRTPPSGDYFFRGIELSFGDPTCTGGNHIYVFNNVFTGQPFFGLYIGFRSTTGTDSVSDIYIENNVFKDVARSGYCVTTAIFNRGDGTITYGSHGDNVDVVFDYNAVYASSSTFNTNISYAGAVQSYAAFKAATGCQVHDVTTDPIMDANFRPIAGSPLIGAGLNLSQYFTTDCEGNLRSAWDMGPYEYGGPVTSYTITAAAGSGGTISPSGSVSVPDGADQNFSIAPNTGYQIEDVLVDGLSQGPVSSYTFSDVAAAHTISASFSASTSDFTINATAGTGGSISPSGNVSVTQGDNQSFTITPNSGYQISDVLVDSASQGAVSTYTFDNVTANHSINAVFVVQSQDEQIGYWKLDDDGGTTAVDSSGFDNTATLVNDPSWQLGGAITMDGNNDALQIPLNNITAAKGTLALWVKASDYSGSHYLIGHTVGTWSNRIQLYVTDAVLNLGLGSSHSVSTDIATLSSNTWYHIVLTWNGTSYVVYVNGNARASGTYTDLTELASFADIGNNGNPSYRDESFAGFIDDVRLYNYALNSTAVAGLYQLNHPPTAHAGNDQTVSLGNSVALNASASFDIDNNIQNYYWQEGSNVVAMGMTPNLSLPLGTHDIKLTVVDNQGMVDTDVLSVLVVDNGENHAPTAQNQQVSMNEDTTETINLLASDPDGDTLNFIVVSPPGHGSLSGNQDALNYDADLNYNGTDSFTFKVNDGSVDSNIATVNIDINPVNDSPVLTQIGNKTTNENTQLAFTLSATDIDSDTLIYSAQNLPDGASLTGQNFSWTPDYSDSGTYSVTFTVDDGSLQDSQTVQITVNNVNRAPVLTFIPNQTVSEAGSLTFDISATDPDNDSLNYSLLNAPAGASLTNQTFNWTPGYDDENVYNLTFIVDDGDLQDSQTMTVTVNNTNRPPVMDTIGSKSVSLNSLLTFTVSATDPDGDAVSYQAQRLPPQATFDGQTFSWTPNDQMLSAYSVLFIVDDGSLQDYEIVPITVTGENHAPVLNTIADHSVDENQNLTFSVSATDPDNDTLTYWAQNLPDGADFSGTSFSWNPDYNDAGTYPVTIFVSDGQLQDSQTFTISVNNVNRPPVLTALTDKTGIENTQLTFSVSATDPDNDPIIYSAQNLPNGASYTDQIFKWTPDFNDAGSYSVTFIASDGSLQAEQTITLTINNLNRPPVLAGIGNKSVDENILLTFSIQADDPDGDNVTYSVQNLPTGASFTNQTFTWTPSFDQAGYHLVTFIAADAQQQDTETITISVGQVNQIPVLDPIGDKSVSENSPLTFTISATDPDNDPITYSAQNLPDGASLTNQTFSWTPTFDQAGQYTVTFIAADAQQQDSQTVTITVSNVNRAPVFTVQESKTVNENQLLSFTLEATDPDGDEVTYAATQLPNGASLNDRFFQWTPGYDDAGSFTASFTASDGDMQDTQSLSITVVNVNRPPTLDYIANKTIDVGSTLNFTVNAVDPDGDAVTYDIAPLPVGAGFSGQAFSWTPLPTQAGHYTVTVTATDGSLSAQQTMTISVGDVNHVPTLMPINNKSVDENSTLSFFITAIDDDGDSITYAAENLPDGAVFADRTFEWTPTFTQAGQYSVTFTASDGQQQDSQTIVITVNNVNRAPVLQTVANKMTPPGSLLSFFISATDPDGDAISYFAQNMPHGASFNGQTFSWTPAEGDIGQYQVTFVASDSQSQDSQTITLTVDQLNNNQAPVFNPIADKTVNENQLLTFSVLAVDPENDPVSYAIDNLPTGATFMNQTFSWTPTYADAGIYTVTFTASDGQQQSAIPVTLTVNNVNQQPVLSPIGDQTVTINTLLSLTITASDPDGDNVVCTASNLPTGATFANNVFQWTPTTTLPPSYSVTFTASDGLLDTSETITITLAEPDVDTTPPVVANCIPKDDAIQTPINSLIFLNITDDRDGIDPDSVAIYVNNNLIYQGNSNNYMSDFGRCKRKGKNNDYLYTYQPTENFDYDQTVTITAQARDLAGNQMTEYQSKFYTEMYSFSTNTPVSITSADVLQAQPASATDSQGNIWVAWEVGPVGNRDIYVNIKSAATGAFQNPIRVTADPADQCKPAVAVDQNGVAYLVWQDNRRGNWDIHVCSSLDGVTWVDETRVTESDDNQTCPVITTDLNNTVWVAWQDDAQGHQDLYIASSSDRFANGTIVPVCTASADQTDPDLAVDAQNNVYMVWTDQRNGSKDIYAATNQNNWANVALVKSAADQSSPSLAIDPLNNALHLAWVDNSAGNNDIWYGSIDRLSSAPITSGRNIVDDTTAANQTNPSIVTAVVNNRLKAYICWKDERNNLDNNNDFDVYFAEVLTGSGTNILATDSYTTAGQTDPAMGLNSKGEPYLVWIDDRNGAQDLYYSELFTINGQLMALGDVNAAEGGLVGTSPDNITSVDDVSVEIPQSAFWTDALLTITKLDSALSIVSAGFVSAYEFSPSCDMEFSQPVTITIPYTVNSPDDTVTVCWYNPQTGTFSQYGITNIEYITISPTLRAIQFKTTHFSQYIITDESMPSTSASGSSSGGCSMSRYKSSDAGILDFFMPYLLLAGIMLCVKRRDIIHRIRTSDKPS